MDKLKIMLSFLRELNDGNIPKAQDYGIKDEDFYDIVDACQDAGYIKGLIGSPDEMQKKLQGLSENDLKNMTDKIDPELIKKLNRGEKYNGK